MTTIFCYENFKVDMIWGEYYHRWRAISPIELLDSCLSMEAVKFSPKCHESCQPISLLILIAFAIERLTVFRVFFFRKLIVAAWGYFKFHPGLSSPLALEVWKITLYLSVVTASTLMGFQCQRCNLQRLWN
jgi:hypothetical protein